MTQLSNPSFCSMHNHTADVRSAQVSGQQCHPGSLSLSDCMGGCLTGLTNFMATDDR